MSNPRNWPLDHVAFLNSLLKKEEARRDRLVGDLRVAQNQHHREKLKAEFDAVNETVGDIQYHLGFTGAAYYPDTAQDLPSLD